MTDSIKHVGLDVHSATIEVAVADGSSGQAGEVRPLGRIPNRAGAVAKLIKKLSPDGQVLCFWYEAGPTGYGLYRQLVAAGHDCHVVAPSLVPRKAGDRVKTDRRDAAMLARLGRAGELTSVWVPGPEQEAMRDLTRCRADAKLVQRVAKQQLGAFLLRHERHYDEGKKKWTKTFFHWLSDQKFESPVQQIVFQEYVDAVRQTSDRVDQLTRQLEKCAQSWSLWPMVQGLCALRGVDLVTAATVMSELGDITRFDSPRQLMAFLGLVPSEHSSGKSRRQGGITKTGNTHVRRVLVESSWCYRFPARMTKHLRAKAKHATPAVQAIAWKAQKRLCGRYQHLIRAGKLSVQANVAVARELAGFIWAIAREMSQPTPGSSGGSGGSGDSSHVPPPGATSGRQIGRVTGSRYAESSATL